MIVGFGHQAQVGKDTAAGMLVARHGFYRLAFADILKEVLYDINPIVAFLANSLPGESGIVRLQDVVDNDGWDVAKGMTETRRLLQDLGVAARWHLDEDVWVKPIIETIVSGPRHNFVVTDVRFPNEFRALQDAHAVMVKITRTGVESNAGQHLSETALDNAEWDWVVPNDGTLLELEETLVDQLMLA